MNKILTIILVSFSTLTLQSCFDNDDKEKQEQAKPVKKVSSIESTNLGYQILHLVEKDKKLFKPLKKDEIEVRYYFSWGCPHCNTFHPYLLKWIKNDSHFKDITFARTPVSLLPHWIDLSRLYYVAKDKGFLQALDVPIFQALHRKNQPLNEWIGDIAKFAQPFVKKAGVNISVDELVNLMEEDSIVDRILDDNDKIIALMLHSTPIIVVRQNDNFYKINAKTSKKNNGIISTLNRLISTLNKQKDNK